MGKKNRFRVRKDSPGVSEGRSGVGVPMMGLSIKLLCVHPWVVVIYGARSRLFLWTRKDKALETVGWEVRKPCTDPSCNAQYEPKVPPRNRNNTWSIFLSGKAPGGGGGKSVCGPSLNEDGLRQKWVDLTLCSTWA